MLSNISSDTSARILRSPTRLLAILKTVSAELAARPRSALAAVAGDEEADPPLRVVRMPERGSKKMRVTRLRDQFEVLREAWRSRKHPS